MKNGNLGGFALGLLGLAVSVYVIGYAWRMSQNRKKSQGGLATATQAEPIEEPKLERGSLQFDGVYN